MLSFTIRSSFLHTLFYAQKKKSRCKNLEVLEVQVPHFYKIGTEMRRHNRWSQTQCLILYLTETQTNTNFYLRPKYKVLNPKPSYYLLLHSYTESFNPSYVVDESYR